MTECAKKASLWARKMTLQAKEAEAEATGKGSSKLRAGQRHSLWRRYHAYRLAASEFRKFAAEMRGSA